MSELVERLRAALTVNPTPIRLSDIAGAAAAIERLRAALLRVDCPGGGWNGMPKDLEGFCTVADCLKQGNCGCIFGAALVDK